MSRDDFSDDNNERFQTIDELLESPIEIKSVSDAIQERAREYVEAYAKLPLSLSWFPAAPLETVRYELEGADVLFLGTGSSRVADLRANVDGVPLHLSPALWFGIGAREAEIVLRDGSKRRVTALRPAPRMTVTLVGRYGDVRLPTRVYRVGQSGVEESDPGRYASEAAAFRERYLLAGRA